ncbi:lactonase family protein [Tunturiibacter gelidoferens]|uniref:6-phosphogluconolactonase (Cycloisomerase 2 family) n=3 Tax=Tunturiibacter TaxID=3154218 RepID=A0A7Y9T1M6_9BACT|nr:beta-propeller fold lactonase family protein [Edaphobacter lichenicola]MBB5340018.1 6-phosphogluconolactonase (cycloisomerase 2 family) [Edaphobacter lichenicola]NYF50668.1 6-phosphogluconolactonase (cycloisomerase 2 family) [Edaphobacter lichenicola]
MKWNKMGRGTVASILSFALVSVTACSRDYTLAYVYVTTAKPLTSTSPNGGINAYAVDFQIGSLTPLADSPIPAGRNPVTLVASPNGLNLYVVNHDDSTIGEYSIGTDGKIYLQNTYNITGSNATAVAMDAAGAFLYVTFQYQLGPTGQQLYSTASPGPGGITIFPISSKDGSLGTPKTVNVGNTPVGVVVSRPRCEPSAAYNAGNPTCTLTDGTGSGLQTSFVYIIDQETPTTPKAALLGFSQNMSTGLLTPTPGTTITTDATGKTVATGYGVGITPSAIAEDPSSRFVYVTDQAANVLYGKTANADGSLTPMVNNQFPTGLFPVGVTVDPRGKFLYVANFSSGTVGAYTIDQNSGNPTGSVGSASTATGTGPTCVAIEPALGVYLYTSNNLEGDVSAFQLAPQNGTLKQVQNTPFPSGALPTCAVAVANGSHPTQIIVE